MAREPRKRTLPCPRNATTGRTGCGVVYLDRFYAHESGELKIVLGRGARWTSGVRNVSFAAARRTAR